MSTRSCGIWMMTLLTVGGCRSKPTYRNSNDRVSVDAPFVNVRVGEQGGAQVRAPFTRVETQAYRQSQAAPTTGVYTYPYAQAPATPQSSTGNSSFPAADANWKPIVAPPSPPGPAMPPSPPTQ